MGNRAGHWADQMAELGGAGGLGGGTGVAAWLIAPLTGMAPLALAGSAAALGAIVGWAIVRAAPGADSHAVLGFEVEEIVDIIEANPLVADLPPEKPDAVAEYSRVVHLFDPPDTPGALQARIAAHLGSSPGTVAAQSDESPAPWNGSPAIPDASDALHAALAEIRRSLRAQ